jgi:predicted DNA-binding antitoxin AbrB/MazE fold protein
MTIQIDAVFENGVLRPLEPLTLVPNQRIRITVEIEPERPWPEDTDELYRASAEEDRRIAETFGREMKATWPRQES